jgi:hypothetical protein
MRLNLLNQTVIMSVAVLQAGLSNLSPRFGSAVAVNDKLFKYAATGDGLNAVLVERVDLAELFDKVPQDITGFTFQDSIQSPFELQASLNIDLLTQEYPVVAPVTEQLGPDDALGVLFTQWKRVVGLDSLARSEVELSTSDDYMNIDARNALLFKGMVQVKIK